MANTGYTVGEKQGSLELLELLPTTRMSESSSTSPQHNGITMFAAQD
jgi:hypothetical protein